MHRTWVAQKQVFQANMSDEATGPDESLAKLRPGDEHRRHEQRPEHVGDEPHAKDAEGATGGLDEVPQRRQEGADERQRQRTDDDQRGEIAATVKAQRQRHQPGRERDRRAGGDHFDRAVAQRHDERRVEVEREQRRADESAGKDAGPPPTAMPPCGPSSRSPR